jgi:hypothetical protein
MTLNFARFVLIEAKMRQNDGPSRHQQSKNLGVKIQCVTCTTERNREAAKTVSSPQSSKPRAIQGETACPMSSTPSAKLEE